VRRNKIMNVSGIVAFISGIVSFFSPCVLPLIPSYLFFISGISFDNYRKDDSQKYRKVVIIHTSAFILGFSLVFVSLGLTSSFIGKVFSVYQTYIVRIGGFVLIIMGLYLLNVIKIPLLNQGRMIHLKGKPLGFLGSVFVGATFSFGWTPCVGPILSSILIIAGTSQDIVQGAYLLGLYSLGLAIPFFISAILFHKLFLLLQKFRAVVRYSTTLLGFILILIGLLFLTNYYGVVTLFFNRAFAL
jgi:cytochrome c-type biogenesis protein